MAWVILMLAAACEVVWAVALKKSDGFSYMGYGATAIGFMLVSFVLLAWAMKHLPVGTAYAAWTGLGALGAALIGMLFMNEPRTAGRLISLLLVLLGVVGLKYFTPDPAPPAGTSSDTR